ncbi:hypothetical protein H2204_013701 [Knufia peltigerae]|uniref:Uncharacterized protein n=1 Tax=Knufia peltigerae TaxID=1002370 RepID=A0AA38XQV2_9EURO|nr:hypothetical protein H2204_013701 [Knufia peltigerae]
MSVPVGITVPKLLPVTGTFAPAFAVYYTVLNFRVSLIRLAEKTALGDSPKTSSGGSEGKPADHSRHSDLFVACRAQSNFADNVPFALILAAIAELNGANRRVMTASLAALLLFRILHVELGMRMKNAIGSGRRVGYVGTTGFLIGMSSYAAYLVKSYWGF